MGLVSRPFLHVMEVSLTLVSYTHFLLVYMDVCGSTYGNGNGQCYSLSVSRSAICGCPALIRAAQNVESRPTTLFSLTAFSIETTFFVLLLISTTSAAFSGDSSLLSTRYGTTASGDISSMR